MEPRTMIEHAHYTYEELKSRSSVFSAELETNPWILYHATSSQAEAVIDSDGFGGRSTTVTKEHISHLVHVYERMNWFGIAGGFSTLKGFTQSRSGIGTPQTWFRETSMRSLFYAHRVCSGGEGLTSYSRAFEDLLEYGSSEEIRRKHLDDQIANCVCQVLSGAIPPPVILVDVDSVLRELVPLRTIYEDCQRYRADYKQGLLYAVRFEESDIPNLFNLRESGILHTGHLSSARIVGKARLDFCGIDSDEIWKLSGNQGVKGIFGWNHSQLAQGISANRRPEPYTSDLKQEPIMWLGENIAHYVENRARALIQS